MNDTNQLRKMTDRELVAYWNILQAPVVRIGEAAQKKARHEPIVKSLLTERRIMHKKGKRISEVVYKVA